MGGKILLISNFTHLLPLWRLLAFFSFAMIGSNCKFYLFIGPNVSTCIFAGEPQRRSLEQSASLYSVGAYKIVGRMIGHMFINRAPPIPYVSPVVNALIKNENPEQYVQLEDLRDYALRAEIKQVSIVGYRQTVT